MAIILDGDNGVTTPVISAGNIVGQVCFFALNTAPTGFLKCNGAVISRTTYADLFAVIGTTFGAGDGTTTFALPDLRGEFIRGWDDGKGTDSGRVFGSSQAHSFASHSHDYQRAGGGSGSFLLQSGSALRLDPSIPTTSVGGTETRPINVALLACIKF